jgi:hypothetical protein
MITLLIAVALFVQTVGTPGSLGSLGSVAGIVCDLEHCNPIAGARVWVETRSLRRTAVTDQSGTFRLTELPPGRYQLNAEADDFTPTGALPVVIVSDGALTSDLKIQMRATGTVSGRARDVDGEPLALARVEALELRRIFNGRALVPVASAGTDDRGEFRLSGLDANDYYIRILPPDRTETYPATFYPAATNPADASKVTVVPGGEVSGIELRLPSRGIKISGTIVGADNEKPLAAVALLPQTSSLREPFSFDMHQMRNEFEIDGVAPGSYYLYAVTDFNMEEYRPAGYRAGPQWVRVPLEVGNKDIEDLKIPIVLAGSIKGRIVIGPEAANSQDLDLSRIELRLGSSEITPSPPSPLIANASKTGEFHVNQVSEMNLFVVDTLLPEGWFVSGVRFDGNDAMSSGFSATPGKERELEITISNASGTLAGTVKDANDKPVPTARLILLPDPSLRANPLLIRTGLASEKGEFIMQVIPPGHYTVIAFPDEDQLTPAYLRDLEEVGKYERFGQQIYINAEQTSRVDLITVSRDTNK